MSLLSPTESDSRIIQMPDLNYNPDPRGLGYVFFHHMVKHKNKIAQVDALTGEKDTYRSLLQRCVRTAVTMKSKGITPNDIVCICTSNHLNSCVPYTATLFLGAKISALDPSLSFSDMMHLLKQVTPKMIFITLETEKLIEEVLKEVSEKVEIVVFEDTTKHTPFSDFLAPRNEETSFKPLETKNQFDTALIFFSSGTTGLPKGICINHFHLLSQLENTIRFGFCLDITLVFTSLYWINAALFLCAAILTGTACVIVPIFEVKLMWDAIHKCRPTLISSGPNQLLAMVKEGCPKGLDISSVKHIATGGAPLLEKHMLAIRRGFPNAVVYTRFGQTEVAMVMTTFKPCNSEDRELMIKKPTSCGRGVPGLSYKVVDTETEEILGPNQPGELRLKTKFVLNGYYNLDSSDVWDSDGWYKTGDVVYYDEDLCFYVVDRIKEMFKFQSWHVQPAVLESVLLTHPGVNSAVVVGIPHEEDINHPMAMVVLKPCKNITPEEIEMYVNGKVDDRKRLRGGVKIVKHIPVSPNGKVKRREIRDMVLRGEL